MLFVLLLTALACFGSYYDHFCFSVNKCPDTIDSNLATLEEYQYCGCDYSYSTVQISENITEIPSYSFYGASIGELKLHPYIESINEGAFCKCYIKINFSEIKNLKTIKDGAFCQAKLTTDMLLLENLDTIGSYAFANCTTIENAIIRAKTIKSKAFFGCHNMFAEKIEILGSGTIEDQAFQDCYQLNGELIIHDAIDKNYDGEFIYSTIGQLSFENSGIKKLNFSYVKKIGSYCFRNCIYLADCPYLNVGIIEHDAFYGCKKLNSIELIEGLDTISESAFRSSSVRHVTTPDSLKSIKSDAFADCLSLYSIHLGKNLEYIEMCAFTFCKKLQSIELPENLKSIGDMAFSYCNKLKSIEIPKNVIIIGSCVFKNSNTELIWILCINATIRNDAFDTGGVNARIYVDGNNSIITMYNSSDKSKYKTYYPIDYKNYKGDIYYINKCLFLGKCGEKADWIFNPYSKTLYVHGSGEMYNYDSIPAPWSYFNRFIKTVITNDKVTSIGTHSFNKCLNLENVLLGKEIQRIGYHAFAPNSLVEIKNKIYSLIVNFAGMTNPICNSSSFEMISKNSIVAFVEDGYQKKNFCSFKIYRSSERENISIKRYIKSKDQIGIIFITSDVINRSDVINERLMSEFQQYSTVFVHSKRFAFNSYLSTNQFILPCNDSIIDYEGGSLNLDLNVTRNCTVIIKKDVKCRTFILKGNNELKIMSENASNSILYFNRLCINGSLSLNIPDYVKTISFNIIQIEAHSSLKMNSKNDKINFICNNFTAKQYSIVHISNLEVLHSLRIYQEASLNMKNLNFESAIISYITFNFDDSKRKLIDPFINVSLDSIPKSLILYSIYSDMFKYLKEKTDYVLVSGLGNKEKCTKWLEILELEKSGFNSKECNKKNQIIVKKGIKSLKIIRNMDDLLGYVLLGVGVIVIAISFIVHFACKPKAQIENSHSLSDE